MELTKIANKLLKKFGVQIVRTPTLERLIALDQTFSEADKGSAEQERSSIECSLEERIAALESSLHDQALQDVIRYAIKTHWRTVDLIDQISGTDKANTCPLCKYKGRHEDFVPVVSECAFLGGRLLRHVCPQCDVIFGPQKMLALDPEMYNLEYRNIYRIYSEENTTGSAIRTFHLLRPTKRGIYLDFGCGGTWSEAIEQLRQEGWNIYGFEPIADHTSEFVFTKWEEIEARTFDAILSHNVLEHLFDPVETTRKLSRLLTAGGRIVHATACFNYRYEYSHYHVYFFEGKSPYVLAERAGMIIEDWVRDGDYVACIMSKAC